MGVLRTSSRLLTAGVLAAVLLHPASAVAAPGPAPLPPPAWPPTPVTVVATGADHSLVVTADGVAWGTGYDDAGQLTTTGGQHVVPGLVPLAGLPTGVDAVAVAGGYAHTLVLGDDGVVYGAGDNASGQLTGDARRLRVLTPLAGLPAGVRAVAVAAGWDDSLVVGDDGTVYGAGSDDHGQLTGAGGDTGQVRTLTSLTGLPAGVRATAAAGGADHVLVLGDDGTVYGAGRDDRGQLTAGGGDHHVLAPLTGLPAGVGATGLSAGVQTSLVLGDDGTAYGAGANAYGQLTGADRRRDTLAPLAGLPAGVAAVQVAAGGYHSLVLGDDGTAYGTGSNSEGQLTGTERAHRLVPLAGLPDGVGAAAVAAGPNHSLVLGAGGTAYGAGSNLLGQLSGYAGRKRLLRPVLATFVSTALPVVDGEPVPGGTLVADPGSWSPAPDSVGFTWTRDGAEVGTGESYSVTEADVFGLVRVAATASGTALVSATVTSEPVFVASRTPVGPATAVAAGERVSVAIGAGRVWASGRGVGHAFTVLPGLPRGVRATAVAAARAVVVLGDDGRAYGWGDNYWGQLTGPRRTVDALRPLTGLPRGVDAIAVASAVGHSLVLGDDGVAYGTGYNGRGQLTRTDHLRRTLAPLTGLPRRVDAVAVSAGGDHSLVLGDDGVAYGTGWNGDGQLTGHRPTRHTLAPLTGLPAGVRAVAVAAGERHSLVLGDDGVAYGTGDNHAGQLTGPSLVRHALVALTGLPQGVAATAVSAGDQVSLVVGGDGQAWGAGSNRAGQLTGPAPDHRVLTAMTGLPDGVRVATASAGRFRHTLVLGDDGLVRGAGSNGSGRLTGLDRADRSSLTPTVWAVSSLAPPAVTGTARPGRLLRAEPGRWTPTPATLAYRWLRDGTAIPGATVSAYAVRPGDRGHRLRVEVTASRPGYLAGVATSTARTVSRPRTPARGPGA